VTGGLWPESLPPASDHDRVQPCGQDATPTLPTISILRNRRGRPLRQVGRAWRFARLKLKRGFLRKRRVPPLNHGGDGRVVGLVVLDRSAAAAKPARNLVLSHAQAFPNLPRLERRHGPRGRIFRTAKQLREGRAFPDCKGARAQRRLRDNRPILASRAAPSLPIVCRVRRARHGRVVNLELR
jgi:hypothetical protein